MIIFINNEDLYYKIYNTQCTYQTIGFGRQTPSKVVR